MKKWIKYPIIIIFIIVIIYLYGRYIEINKLITKEYTISSSKLPDSFDGIKIVHITDLHYGRDLSKKQINKIVDEINLIKPDILVFTGDLVEHPSQISDSQFKFLESALLKIKVKINKYAVLGNHDYDYGIEKVKTVLSNSEFIVLQNSYDTIYNNSNEKIIIYGIDDVLKEKNDIDKTFEYNEDTYKIVLVHEPDYVDDIIEKDDKINLILAGHSHNGQARIPFIKKIHTPKGSEKYYDNFYKKGNTLIYVSSGIGVSKVTFRFYNPPAINFYRINKED